MRTPPRRANRSGKVNLGTWASSYSTSGCCATERRQDTSTSGAIRFNMYLIVIPLTAALEIVEPITQNRLDQQMVRRLRHSHADAEIEFPVLAEIDIHRRQELLLLVPDRIPSRDGPIRAVILQAERHLPGHVIAELHVGRKLETQALSRTVERAVQGGIERQIGRA